jgi:hypothetical protein
VLAVPNHFKIIIDNQKPILSSLLVLRYLQKHYKVGFKSKSINGKHTAEEKTCS